MNHPSAFDPKSSSPSDQPQLQLVIHAGPLAGKGFPITGDTLTFGRGSENDISLDDSQVSRLHARLIRQGNQIIIEDLGSTNGTLVNGKPISGQHVLQPADIISIGSSVFGVKGFAAPHTVGVTQISMEKPTYTPAARATISPRPAPRPGSQPSPVARTSQTEKPARSRLNVLVIGGGVALIVIILIIAAITAYFFIQNQGSSVAAIPTVVITAPVSGSQVQVNTPVTVQATASDPSGVVRMELWVSGVKTAEAVSPVPQGQATLTASFQWTPAAAGTYTLEVKAFNERGQVSAPTTVTVTSIGDVPASPETITSTITVETPVATVPGNPSLTTKTDLNVRAGPSIQYDLLGLLPAGTNAEIIGRDDSRQWWKIRFSPSPDGTGWVAADPAFSTTSNTENIPIAQAPPTPTGTPTNTPIPLTDTPTATSIPPTFTSIPPTFTPIPPTPTPTDTPTATSEPSLIEFDVSPTSIQGGECVRVTWNVSGVKEVYYEGDGVGGTGNITECPQDSTTYSFRVVRLDDSEYTEDIDVTVINPIISSGTITLNPNQTIDFDEGRIPGDDFLWSVNGGVRRFEIQGSVQLAPRSETSNLANLPLAECAAATYNEYTFIDASDGANPGLINTLIQGRAACYRTNQGRLGKLRFPEYSTGSLRVEWLTWK